MRCGIISSARRRSSAAMSPNVVLLMGFEGANGSTTFTDESSYGHVVTPHGTSKISTAYAVAGASSLRLDTAGDYLSLADSNDWNLGADPFTIEGWIKTTTSGVYQLIIGQRNGASQHFSLTIRSDNQLEFLAYFTDTTGVQIYGGNMSTPGLYHVAVSRNASGKFRVRLNGEVVASATSAKALDNYSDLLTIGAAPSGGTGTVGQVANIDELWIVKNVDLYDTDAYVTPPSSLPRSAPVFSVTPVISSETGFYGIGDILNATSGTLAAGLATFAYQWNRDGAPIGGATSSSYTLVSGDLGANVTVTVTASNVNGSTSSTSSSVGPVVTPAYTTHTRVPAGDMQSGSDSRLTAGDMQSGSDLRISQERTA